MLYEGIKYCSEADSPEMNQKKVSEFKKNIISDSENMSQALNCSSQPTMN
jgi:hypothetical protein